MWGLPWKIRRRALGAEGIASVTNQLSGSGFKVRVSMFKADKFTSKQYVVCYVYGYQAEKLSGKHAV